MKLNSRKINRQWVAIAAACMISMVSTRETYAVDGAAQPFKLWVAGQNHTVHVGAQVKIERFTPEMARQISAAGLDFVRFGVWTNAMQTPAYRRQVEKSFDAARDAKLPVIVTVRDTAPLIRVDTSDPGAQDEQLRAAAARLSATIVELSRNYGSEILAIELWNEPEFEKYWPTGHAEKTFPVYMRAVCAGLQQIRGTTSIIGFAFATMPLPGSLPDQLLLGAGVPSNGCIDAVSWHAYGKSAEEIAHVADQVRARFDLPTVITEWGVSSGRLGTESGQAAAVAAFLRERNTMHTPLISIYEWQNTTNAESSKERNFGLVNADGARKPALDALRSTLKGR
ncbi:Cellulase (Glycosyl hydrolase family 5) [Paraburkholderia tropica]|uniref:cellulase family glycosylhydrolase n=1 Tax=Paraburkholderia tropica TaxID=92647 RepID=UPI001CAAFDA5|nr:cellulase family glycosylhydrolase [Paraburkholderia tropica]CAG9238454.1 Cellulase (Glycosyl hydrolase family 5) [Paraburkholderia tropica]